MASSGKKKTTMAKLMRETRLRERRAAKKAKKDERKRNPPTGVDEFGNPVFGGAEGQPGDEFAESAPGAAEEQPVDSH